MFLTKEIILPSLWWMIIPYSLYAQAELGYSGPYKVGEFEGKAEFSYKLVDGDTVLNGAFEMENANLGDLLSKQDHYFFFGGAFVDDVPTGPWRFKFGAFSLDSTARPEVRDYHYRVKTKGIHHEASGDIFEGTPQGKWQQTVSRVTGSQVQEALFKSTIDFEKGIPQKSFNLQNDRLSLMGRFLRDGLAHDVWELYSTEALGAIERWYFKEGQLEKIILQNDASTDTLQVYTGTIENPKILDLDDRYLGIIQLNQRLASGMDSEIEVEMNDLLAENSKYYQKIGKVLSGLEDSRFMPKFKVKSSYDPLKDNELNDLSSIKTHYMKSERISKELLKSSQLNILTLSDNETSFLVSVAKEISQNHLAVLKEVTTSYEKDILPFVPRENLLSKLWPAGTPFTGVTVTYEREDSLVTRSYLGPDAESYAIERDGIAGTLELAKYTYGCLASIQRRLNEKLSKEQRQVQLMMLEEDLIAEMEDLNDLVDSLEEETLGETKNALNSVKKTAKQELGAYSALQDMLEKPGRARLLTGCFGQMQELSKTVATQDARTNEIKVAYTDEVWNPFTATVMSEEVKRRIVEAYREVLLPYLFQELDNTLSCNTTGHLLTLLEKVHQRMLELRTEDTSKLERKLKKERDPLVIMRLLNIQTDDKTVGP